MVQFMANLIAQNTRHANRATVTFNGTPIGLARSITVQESTNPQPTHSIGTEMPWEHTHSAYSCSVTIGRVVWDGDAIEDVLGTTSADTRITYLPTFDLEILEGPAGEGEKDSLIRVKDITIGQRGISINMNQPITSDISGQALAVVSSSQVESDPYVNEKYQG
jgi:hypothetical protein